MSRIVRDSQASGLRERIYFARLSYQLLEEGQAQQAPYARQLALRGAVVFHLYSVLIGLLRLAAANYKVQEAGPQLSLKSLQIAFRSAGVESGEINLVMQALETPSDLVHWLNEEALQQFAAAGLARRPQPRDEQAPLQLHRADEGEKLGELDMARLEQTIDRVSTLVEDCAGYMDEW